MIEYFVNKKSALAGLALIAGLSIAPINCGSETCPGSNANHSYIERSQDPVYDMEYGADDDGDGCENLCWPTSEDCCECPW